MKYHCSLLLEFNDMLFLNILVAAVAKFTKWLGNMVNVCNEENGHTLQKM